MQEPTEEAEMDETRRYVLQEEQRQLVLLAVAELALSRPGFDETLGNIADLFFGREMFAEFKRLNADRVKASHDPCDLVPVLTDISETLRSIRVELSGGNGLRAGEGYP